MWLLIKNLAFTVLVPGTVAVFVPVVVIRHNAPQVSLASILAFVLLAVGGAIYAWCVVGRDLRRMCRRRVSSVRSGV